MARLLPWDTSELQAEAAEAVVHVSRIYDAPRHEVFAAWTEPALLTQWFRPVNGVSTAELDVRPGGKYRIVMDPQGELPGPATIVGTYLEVDPPQRLVFSFGWELPPPENLEGLERLDPKELEDRLEDLRSLDSRVTVQFHEDDGATEVEITHERLDTQRLRAFHIFGWRMVLARLPEAVRSTG
jgi:uncharacterized protein YndB with AHSA1/START domain